MKRFAVSFLGVLMIVMAVSGCTGKKPAEQYVSEQLTVACLPQKKQKFPTRTADFTVKVNMRQLSGLVRYMVRSWRSGFKIQTGGKHFRWRKN